VRAIPHTVPDLESWGPVPSGYARHLCSRCGCTRIEDEGENRRDEWCEDGECPCHDEHDALMEEFRLRKAALCDARVGDGPCGEPSIETIDDGSGTWHFLCPLHSNLLHLYLKP
jgi:hypothetical protein